MLPARLHTLPAALALALGATLLLGADPAQTAGLDIHPDASAADVGLPLYPGAVKKPKDDDDHAGLSFGIWGDSFGLKLVAVSYASKDGVDPVAAFYRDALAKYGPVLDCSGNQPKGHGTSHGASIDIDSGKGAGSKPLSCDGDGPDVAGGRLYKVGTKADQRLFSLKPAGDGVTFDLVRLQVRGDD